MQKQEMIQQQQQQQQQQPDSTYHDYYTSDQSSYSIGTPAPYQESSTSLYQEAYPDPAIAYQDPLNLQYSNEGYYDDMNPSIYQSNCSFYCILFLFSWLCKKIADLHCNTEVLRP